jgi:hypothetical protein
VLTGLAISDIDLTLFDDPSDGTKLVDVTLTSLYGLLSVPNAGLSFNAGTNVTVLAQELLFFLTVSLTLHTYTPPECGCCEEMDRELKTHVSLIRVYV